MGGGRFGPPSALKLKNFDSALQVISDDWNGDGHPDLASVDANNTVSLFLGQGNGVFGDEVM